jgi:hypothetical protein
MSLSFVNQKHRFYLSTDILFEASDWLKSKGKRKSLNTEAQRRGGTARNPTPNPFGSAKGKARFLSAARSDKHASLSAARSDKHASLLTAQVTQVALGGAKGLHAWLGIE